MQSGTRLLFNTCDKTIITILNFKISGGGGVYSRPPLCMKPCCGLMLSFKAGAGGSFWEATYSARLMEYGQFDGWSANRLTPLSQPINHSPLHMPVVGQICGLFHSLLGGSFNYLHSCKHSSCTILTLFPGRPLPASFPARPLPASFPGPSQLRSQAPLSFVPRSLPASRYML